MDKIKAALSGNKSKRQSVATSSNTANTTAPKDSTQAATTTKPAATTAPAAATTPAVAPQATKPIKLYSHAGGPNPWKVAIIMNELNVPVGQESFQTSDQ
jgi:glutathione S-transferase